VSSLLLLLLQKVVKKFHMATDAIEWCKEAILGMLLFCGYVRVCVRESLKT